MGTDNSAKIIPLAAAGRLRSADGNPPAWDAMLDLSLSRRRGFETVESAAPRSQLPALAPTASAEIPLAEDELAIDAPRLCVLFIASLDDQICKREKGASDPVRWPRSRNAQLDKTAIDIIDMLFGFILDDLEVPRGVKESLLAAQMPMLQMAVREPAFFADWLHPARQLLNDIAPLCKLHRDRGGDTTAFTAHFVSGMARVLDDLAPNSAAFAIFHESLREFASGIRSQPTQGPAAWQRAEAAARNILERPLPESVRDFVAGYWIDVLERTAEAHDEDSPQWQDAVAVVEDLAWSLTPKADEESRFRLIGLIPALLARLNRGLDLIEIPREDRRPFFDTLIDIHADLLRVETTPVPPRHIEESVADQVARLQRGDWVQFSLDDGTTTRERLTWISPQRGILVFSNHQGQRAIQIAPDELAERVRQGMATLIFDQPIAEGSAESA